MTLCGTKAGMRIMVLETAITPRDGERVAVSAHFVAELVSGERIRGVAQMVSDLEDEFPANGYALGNAAFDALDAAANGDDDLSGFYSGEIADTCWRVALERVASAGRRW